MTNLLVKIAGAFGPSNAGEAQAQARRRTGGEDRPQATGAFRNWDGGGMGPGVDPNSSDYRAQRQMSAGAQPPPPPQQPVQPKEEDEDDGGLGGGGWLMGGLLGAGLAAGGKYLYDKYVPMYREGMEAKKLGAEAMKNVDELNNKFDMKLYKALGINTNQIPERTLNDDQVQQRWMQLKPEERKRALNAIKILNIESERAKDEGWYGRFMRGALGVEEYGDHGMIDKAVKEMQALKLW